jgi:phosphoglycerol transferase MdoB-like AlkP superfamily enzyme
VLTSDHTNQSDHAFYQTDLGGFCSPIIIYDASGEQEPRIEDKIAQQIDIMPTILGMLHYQKPYLGFGIDVLNTPSEETWAVNYLNGIYQYVKNDYVLQFNGQEITGLYALTDSLMQQNLLQTSDIKSQTSYLKELKAIIQQYMERMTQDRLTP